MDELDKFKKNGYLRLNARQDLPFAQGSLGGPVTWVLLVDIDVSNFPLEVVPGSHKNGLLRTLSEGSAIREVDLGVCDMMEASIGDVVFMPNFTLNQPSTFGIPSSYHVAVSTGYDNASEETYIQRCCPTAYQRMVRQEIPVKNFPTKSGIDKIFIS